MDVYGFRPTPFRFCPTALLLENIRNRGPNLCLYLVAQVHRESRATFTLAKRLSRERALDPKRSELDSNHFAQAVFNRLEQIF